MAQHLPNCCAMEPAVEDGPLWDSSDRQTWMTAPRSGQTEASLFVGLSLTVKMEDQHDVRLYGVGRGEWLLPSGPLGYTYVDGVSLVSPSHPRWQPSRSTTRIFLAISTLETQVETQPSNHALV